VGALTGTLLTFGANSPVQAQSVPDFPGGASFSAYGSGSAVHADVIDADVPGPRVVDANVAHSGAAFNTGGLDAGIVSEVNTPIVPKAGASDAPVDSAGKESYGKGSGVEVGLGQDLPNLDDADQIKLVQTGAASEPPVRSDGEAAPDSASTGLVESEILAVPAAPLLYADAGQARSGAVWSNKTCIVGQPLAFGEGTVADAQVLAIGADNAETGNIEGALITTDSEDGDDVIDSQSFTYLIANKNADGTPDGTYGVVSETRMILAPVTLAEDATTGQGALQINVAGEWFFRVTATGKGPATVQYGLVDPPEDPDTPIIQVLTDGVLQGGLNFQDLFGETGLVIPGLPLAQVSIGEDPRAIAAPGATPDPESQPTLTTTEGSAAVDVASIILLKPGDVGTHLADIRIGHMEASVKVPAGGFRCRFPVSKTGPSTVNTGQEFEWTIKIPSDPHALDGVSCDIVGIAAIDHLETVSGNPRPRLTSASNGGVISSDGQRATWANLGSYKNGDPPITVTVKGTAAGAGTFQNVVDVTATLGNCNGGGLLTGEALASFLQGANLVGEGAVSGGAQISGTGATGGINAEVLGQALPATGGGANTLYVGLAMAALLSAAGVYRLTRKAQLDG
jgi:hypothetical protein